MAPPAFTVVDVRDRRAEVGEEARLGAMEPALVVVGTNGVEWSFVHPAASTTTAMIKAFMAM
jgi:hypothetical protein